MLRIRSDEQLVTFFREGNDDAFRVIHDRYRPRLCAYTRQMLAGTGQDAEDAVQEIFMRAYYGLRANNRELALRAWLYRIAHNRCIDELRRPHATVVEAIEALVPNVQDPVARAEQRDALRRLIADVQRLPDQQRSALLMRELSGMTYADVSAALGVSIPAVKSLLVRARVSLAQASEARDTACAHIREDLILSHDRGVRTSGLARRHMRDCTECRRFRSEVRGVNRSLASLAPTLGPLGVIANVLGLGGGGGAAAGGGAAGGGAAAGAAGTGAVASTGLLAGGATHVVTLLAAAVVTAGGAVELHNTLAAPHHRAHHHAPALVRRAPPAPIAAPTGGAAIVPTATTTQEGTGGSAAAADLGHSTVSSSSAAGAGPVSHGTAAKTTRQQPLTMTLDPDNLRYVNTQLEGSTSTTAGSTGTGTGTASGTSSPAAGTGIGGTAGPSATGTGGPVTTGTGSPSTTSGPSGATTSASSPSSNSASSTGSTASGSATAGGAQSSSGTAASPAGSSSSTSPSATTNSSGGSTSSTAASNSVGSSAASTNSSKVLNFVTTKHRPRHKILVGRLL